jgi:ABC-type branched-subunit amino acid transport system permease subunit
MMERVSEPSLKTSRWRDNGYRIVFAVMLAVLVAAPFVTYPLFLMQCLCFALFACAFNLLIGYVGLLSFGHALYFGWASYVTAYAAKTWGFPPELAILAGTLTGALLGVVAGALAIRRQGIYFAMITLALAQMMYFVALRVPFTAARTASRRCHGVICSAFSIFATRRRCTSSCWPSSLPASCSSTASFILRSVRY